MDYLPIFTRLENRHCLVVGGGDIAQRKIHLLLKAGAKITVCAPEINDSILEKSKNQELTIIKKTFSEDLLLGKWLVIAATNQSEINKEIANKAHAMQLLINVVDDPVLSTFIMPSIVDRSPMVIAISSGGKAPVLARLIRERFEALLPMHLGALASISGEFRHRVKSVIKNVSFRRRYWEALFDNPKLVNLLNTGKKQSALALMEDQLKEDVAGGEITFIGSGPGDPSLLTLRALQLIQQADIVIHDQTISPEILDLVRRDAVLKQVKTDWIQTAERLAIHFNKQERVVRLVVGDGVSTESHDANEKVVLTEKGISFQTVQGVSVL